MVRRTVDDCKYERCKTTGYELLYGSTLKALEFVGYEWKRDADGKHTLFK